MLCGWSLKRHSWQNLWDLWLFYKSFCFCGSHSVPLGAFCTRLSAKMLQLAKDAMIGFDADFWLTCNLEPVRTPNKHRTREMCVFFFCPVAYLNV